MEKDFKDWFKWTVTIKRVIGIDMYGKNIYDTGTAYPCFIQRTNKLLLDRTGKETVSDTQIFFDKDVSISLDDKIILPDGQEIKVIQVAELPDENGQIHHKVVYSYWLKSSI